MGEDCTDESEKDLGRMMGRKTLLGLCMRELMSNGELEIGDWRSRVES